MKSVGYAAAVGLLGVGAAGVGLMVVSWRDVKRYIRMSRM